MTRQRLVQKMIRFRQFTFIQVLQQTMLFLFPIVLIGSFATIVSNNLLSPQGFLGSLCHINRLPQHEFVREIFGDVATITTGWLAPYAAMVSAILTTKYFKRTNVISGLVAVVCYVLIFYHSLRNTNTAIDMRYYGVAWFIIGVFVGYIVGLVFKKYGQGLWGGLSQGREDLLKAIFHELKPILLVLFGAFLLHILYALYRSFGLDAIVAQTLSSYLHQHSNYVVNILISLLSTLLIWLGFSEPLNLSSQVFSSEVFANLNYALTHKTTWHIPYPFTPSALYTGYAQFGGVGVSLALLIAILWVSHHKSQQRLALYSGIPVFFNIPAPLGFGIGLPLNPVYFIPFVLLPIFNMVVASFLIYFHLIPTIVYPTLSLTPGILIPFMGTGGNFLALILSIMLLIIDTIVYIPFVKFANEVEDQLIIEEGGSL